MGGGVEKSLKPGRKCLSSPLLKLFHLSTYQHFYFPSTLLDELHIMLNNFWWESGGGEVKGVKWEKVFVWKEMGGRGFGDLHLFNVALLGKMGWRLVHDDTSLVCKVLKARYFPNSSFLDTRMGSNSSYTWTSIFACQDMLRVGSRWKIGTGENVRVWGCLWMRDDNSFWVNSDCPAGLKSIQVSELIIENASTWDVGLLQALVEPADVLRITRTPLPPIGMQDKLVWHFSRDGLYSVKTGYRLAYELRLDPTIEV